jgi:hypothetical protein
MNTSSDQLDPVELLAEEFLERKRHGEKPTLRESQIRTDYPRTLDF